MAKIISVSGSKEDVPLETLVKGGIHDWREWNMSVHDAIELEYAVIGPHGSLGTNSVKHENEEVAFMIKGELVYVINGKEIKVPENSAIFIPAGEPHYARNDTNETALRLSIEAHPEWGNMKKNIPGQKTT